MKIKWIKLNGRYVTNETVLPSFPTGGRLYRILTMNKVEVMTDEGKFTYIIYPNFVTNYRSGGPLVDIFIDQMGSIWSQLAYLVHDLNYTPCLASRMEHPLSRKASDGLLKAMLIFGKMGFVRARIVYRTVRLFGGLAYKEDDSLTELNSQLFRFEWTDK